MTDNNYKTGTNNNSIDANTTNKSKQEINEEKRKEKYAAKVEKQKVIALGKLEAKKNKLNSKLVATSNPKKKSEYQDKIDNINKEINRIKISNKTKKPFKEIMRTWRKGLHKEANRVDWTKKRDLSKDFVTILLVCAFLASIFFGIDMIIISIR